MEQKTVNHGDYYCGIKNFDTAIEFFRKSIHYFIENHNSTNEQYLYESFEELQDLYLEQGFFICFLLFIT